MVDFLKSAKATIVETVTVAGVKVEVRGLSVRELRALTAKHGPKANDDFIVDLICACCFYAGNGKPLIPEERKHEVGDLTPAAFTALTEAVSKVNGYSQGNSNATVADASSSE